MTAPSSYARILAALKRISPPWPFTDTDTSVGMELGSIATALGMAADPLDGALDEVFPDTTTELIDRWEQVTRVPTRTADAIADRRTRVLSVLRRSSGARLDQLEKMLAGPFDLDIEDIIFVEQLRQFIDDALTNTITGTWAITGTARTFNLGKPWPGDVDDTGVRVYVAISALGTPTVTLTSPEGTTWAVPVTATSGWYENRDDFLDERAGGKWTLSVANGSAVNLTEAALLVSNDVDAAQIYNFFAYRDPNIAGDADITEAQRLFRRTAHGHMNAAVIQSLAFTVDDEYSLVDRDPVGV
jgi:hypothetical protein